MNHDHMFMFQKCGKCGAENASARGQCTSFGCKFEKRKRKLKENMPSTSDVAHMKDLLEKKVYLLPSLDFTSSVTLFHFVFVFSWF